MSKKFYVPYTAHSRCSFHFTQSSMVRPEFQKESDINDIVKNYSSDNLLYNNPSRKPHYGDFSSTNDYLSACDLIDSVNDYFDSLPSNLRDRFANDPSNFLDYINDPKNLEEASKLGLVEISKDATDDVALKSKSESVVSEEISNNVDESKTN